MFANDYSFTCGSNLIIQVHAYMVISAGNEVFYIDCTNIPLEHLELVIREVYLPLMCTNQGKIATGGDKVMDILHRLMSVVEVSQGHVEVRPSHFLNSVHYLSHLHFGYVHTRRGSSLHPSLQSLEVMYNKNTIYMYLVY